MIRITLLSLVISGTASAQNTPGPRDHFSMIYNPDRKSIILYGGSYMGADGNYKFASSTWEWKNNSWLQLDTGAAIGAKGSHVMAYDRNNKNIVLFGGIRPGELLSDTWTWNSNSWKKFEGAGPSPRHSSLMVYYPKNNNVLLFSGHKREGTFEKDSWIWNGKEWILKTTDGPLGRSRAGYCVDVHRNKVILFGGYMRGKGNANDMWEWDGEKWDSIPQPDLKPTPRSNMYLVYDARRKKVVLYGGSVTEEGKSRILDELWEWDGRRWEKIVHKDGPGENEMYGMIYHEDLGKVFLYGGRCCNPIQTKADMWTWDGKRWEMLK